MDSLIYSLNSTLPIFLTMLVGYVLRRIGMLNNEFVNAANKFNFKITLPVMLFVDLAATDIRNNFDLRYVLFCAAVTTVMFSLIWICAKLFIKDKSIVGAFVQASYRSSVAVLGIAFIKNICGSAGMAPVMIIGCVPLYNIFAVIVLTFEAQGDCGSFSEHIKKSLKNIATNPIIIGILAGIAASLINLKFPSIIDRTLNNLAVMSTPLALITIGAAFEGKKAIAKIKPTIAASLIKLVVLPAVFLTAAIKLGFRGEELLALIIMLGSPTTASSYIMAKSMNNDDILTSSVIVTTTLLSALTLTFWIFISRYLGYIG